MQIETTIISKQGRIDDYYRKKEKGAKKVTFYMMLQLEFVIMQ